MGMRTASALLAEDNGQPDRKFALGAAKPWLMLEFFAGSGLVSHGLKGIFTPVWANDICPKKAAVYKANRKRGNFILEDIQKIKGEEVPAAHLSWASFPCQDLSLAGATGGINASRSGMVWQWLRILDEMPVKPRILVAENVVGLVSSHGGANYKALHQALAARGYRAGAILLDAVQFVPQSRPRIFVIAVSEDIVIPESLIGIRPNWLHSDPIIKACKGLPKWIWWSLPHHPAPRKNLRDVIEWDAPGDPPQVVKRNLDLMAARHREHLLSIPDEQTVIAAGYKRTRHGKQVLELRFDGVAGCLRTPDGGSSRQVLVIKKNGEITTRLLTVRETARLMGAADSFKLPGTYNDGYRAMGDAVAAPVARYLGRHLLSKLMEAAYE